MRKDASFAGALLLVGQVLVGCEGNQLGDLYNINPVVSRTGQEQFSPVNIDTFKFKEITDKTAMELAGEDAKYRDRLQIEIMTRSNVICDQHTADIRANKDIIETSLSGLAITLAGAATVVTGNLGREILILGSGLAGSYREVINANIYENNLVNAIINAISSKRIEINNVITEKRKKPLDSYGPEEANSDAYLYHRACSFSVALASINNSVTHPAPSRPKLEAESTNLKTERDKVIVALQKAKDPTIIQSYQSDLKRINDRLRMIDILMTVSQ